ncbi:hypothetical protein L6452_05502 [Arctium lappa]|uniref:Uncharacterized protein n=1 Tax=Arctium lappa TaxID=4217 RepID=A0ACB9EGK4_ARCLA|nr:hypothetical protein L6452_05502 [Arctium lappa]
MVMKKKAKLDKQKPKTVDPIALLASQMAEQALTESAYDGSTDDDGEALEKVMILLSQHYQKKYQKRSGSNNLRFSSGSKKVEPGSTSKPFFPKYEPGTAAEPKKEEKKAVTCYNCGKPGHISKECRTKIVKDVDFYKKKLALAEKKASGTILLAEEEYWLDHSDNEADNVETAAMCFIGDDNSDDEDEETSSDESEVPSEFDFNFISSQMNVITNALHDFRSKLISEKRENQEKSVQIEKLKISLRDEKAILKFTKEKFQERIEELEIEKQTSHDSLSVLSILNQEFSDKIFELEEKLYKQNQTEQTVHMHKPRSYESLKENWGLGFKNP